MTAATLRSSEWNRSPSACSILDGEEGRIRIFVIQLCGHLFFGNISLFADGIKDRIRSIPADRRPYVVSQMWRSMQFIRAHQLRSYLHVQIIIDCTLVLGIDSSAAQAILKLRDSLANQFGIRLCIFVPGAKDGFPCEINLSEELKSQITGETTNGQDNEHRLLATLTGSQVCDDLDAALVFAEDALIAWVDPRLLYDNIKQSIFGRDDKQMESLEDEKSYAIELLLAKCPGEERAVVERFFSHFTREVYSEGDTLWKQGALSDSAKLLVSGELLACLENEAETTETISIGSVIGESGLVQRQNRNSTVNVLADGTVLYSLSQDSWEALKESDPRCAQVLYVIVVRYLTLRVQHCSNRIFETRCLPV